MVLEPYNILLADDDLDDCLFFKEALEQLPISWSLHTVHNGEQLMQYLSNKQANLPDMLFLDLNMPRKSGVECLSEIKSIEKLRQIRVVIYSTSIDHGLADLLYNKGAYLYVRKPNVFANVTKVINQVIMSVVEYGHKIPSKENFIIQL